MAQYAALVVVLALTSGLLQLGLLNIQSPTERRRSPSPCLSYMMGSGTSESTSIPSPFQLQYNWSHMELQSELARRLQCEQTDCAKRRFVHEVAQHGMGSGIHEWIRDLQVAVANGAILVTEVRRWNTQPTWSHDHRELCTQSQLAAPMTCWFGPAVSGRALCGPAPQDSKRCTHRLDTGCTVTLRDRSKVATEPSEFSQVDFDTAAVEFLFSHLSPLVVARAEAQIRTIFGDEGIPRPMITVHVRWGDKVAGAGAEMEMVNISTYLDAVSLLVETHSLGSNPAVFLATKDTEAYGQFRRVAPSGWRVYAGMDGRARVKAHRDDAGIDSLAALLIAMEAYYFVLTTASNWSLLMDELRRAVVEPRCRGGSLLSPASLGSCSDMIDLRPSSALFARIQAAQRNQTAPSGNRVHQRSGSFKKRARWISENEVEKARKNKSGSR